MKQKKRLTIPATLAVLTLAAACSTAPTPSSNDPCTEEFGPDCAQAQGPDGGIELAPDGGIECLC